MAEVASQTQALALLLGGGVDGDGDGDDGEGLEVGGECLLLEERREEARVGYEGLKLLNATNFDASSLFYLLRRC